MTLIFGVILIALVFEYINGFHDTANSIATVVATKVLTPRLAVAMAACTNLLGALWGTAVAKTIASGLIDPRPVSGCVFHSTFKTSAPSAARNRVEPADARNHVKSKTRTPWSGKSRPVAERPGAPVRGG